MRKHRAAVKARIEAASVLTGKVHDAVLVDASGALVRTSYAILFGGGPEERDDDRLASLQSVGSDALYEYRVRSVGASVDAALAVAGVVETQLDRFEPVVPGRSCNPMWLDDASEVEADDSVKPPLFYMDQWFRLKSNRA